MRGISRLAAKFTVSFSRRTPLHGVSKAKCQGKTRKDGARPALFHISCCFCCSVYCLCVNVHCHRVTSQLQLINISYHINNEYYQRYLGISECPSEIRTYHRKNKSRT
jgi:hypothetical protein